ncbi:MAG: type VI secretion system baseplate subunit TssG [Planctomycetota bacterium]
MADQDRPAAHLVKLLERLDEDPHGFNFYQAVRLLDCEQPDKPAIGCSERVADDAVRFAQEPSMGFPPSTLTGVEKSEDPDAPRRLLQRFFGVFGPNGALPMHLTEYAVNRVRDRRDRTFHRFVDTFHHRMASLFYRAWSRVRPTVSFDKPKSDRFGDYVGSLFGLGMSSVKDRDAMADLPKRHFSGLLSNQAKCAEGLLALVYGYFRFPVQIQECVGQWIELPPSSRCYTGQSSSSLGVSTTVGSHIWDVQQKFRVIIGPLTLDEYIRMLPRDPEADPEGEKTGGPAGRKSLDAMIAVVRTYIGDELDWDLQLILKREETPPVKLGEEGMLGWTSWMPAEKMDHDPDDLVLEPMAGVFAKAMEGAM